MSDGRRTGLLVVVIAALGLALMAFYLPWVTHTTAGFTMNGFDLAEWTSLHPATRSGSPPMLTPFLLRAPQVAIAIGLALAAGAVSDRRWCTVGWAAALAIALRMIPPVEFWQGARGDPNYRQMALLTAIGVGGVALVALVRLRGRYWFGVLVIVLVAGVLAGWAGLSRAGVLLDNFEIAVKIGAGPALYTLAAVVAGLTAGLRAARRK
ncbi:MAG: hypothetical protein IT325_05835 [Anaerolineae bacterium]|nr:hypothetical protein [Anaerolineae bacterium]